MNSKRRNQRKGAALILVCFLIGLVFIAVAFSLDVARIQLAQMELQLAADVAARAGAEAMARGVGDPNNSSASDAAIRAEIDMVASLNTAGGNAVLLNLGNDIEFGRAIQGTNSAPQFQPTADGSVDNQTDSVRVRPSISDYPLVFGSFVGTTDIDPVEAGAAMVQERDIVLVLDKSTSMMKLDAGQYPIADFNSNLRQLQDDLFLDGDDFHPNGSESSDTRHTEFEVASSGSDYNLSRQQALKLAVFMFRQQIDISRGHEQLGLVSYALFANVPTGAPAAPGPVDIVSGLPTYVRNAIVGDGITKSNSSSPYDQHITERNASALEDDSNSYANFDFNYLRMRWARRTNIADGIDKGVQVLFGPGRRAFATPILILMTDGQDNEGGKPTDAASAAIAAHPNLRIYTVSLGSDADQVKMQQVANIGLGKHYHASSVNALIAAYVELAQTAGVTLIE